MIIKSYELNKINLKKNNIYLLYGENEGLKNKVINDIFKEFSNNAYKYDEKEILDNKENFFNSVLSKSFFETKKFIMILRSTDKIVSVIEDVLEKITNDTKIILLAGILEKKSKLRLLFEKNKNIVCIPFYSDNDQTLSSIASSYFKERKIPVSQEIINLLVARSRGDRLNLNNEITKIENFINNKKKININDILKLTNLAENYSVNELVDSCLAKKTKLRLLFEKNKNIICIPFYADNKQTLSNIANSYFKEKKIPISQEIINLLVARSRGDRLNLNNEIIKIENFVNNKKNININDILKLTNLAENYSVTELVDNCLAKRTAKTINILNENNYSAEDCILIIKTFLIKANRLNKLHNQTKDNKNIDQVITSFKPPIFWKDKEIVKEQIKNWSIERIENLIYKINEIELLIKKNSTNALNILFNFIVTESNKTNN